MGCRAEGPGLVWALKIKASLDVLEKSPSPPILYLRYDSKELGILIIKSLE